MVYPYGMNEQKVFEWLHNQVGYVVKLEQQNAALVAALKKAKYLMDEDEDGHKIAYVVIAKALALAKGDTDG